MYTDILLASNASTPADGENNRHALVIAKIVTIVVMFIITAIIGFLPYMLDRCFKWTQQSSEMTRSSVVVQSLLFFGGGVLIATIFLHIFPDVVKIVGQLQYCGILATTPFALPEMLVCTGFYLMYTLEEIMHAAVRRHREKRGHIISKSFQTAANSEKSTEILATEIVTVKEEVTNSTNEHCHDHLHLPSHEHYDSNASMRGLGIILALSLHELFGGMAIGLEMSVSTVWFMFGAISAHKLVLAFCVGMEVLVYRTPNVLAIVYIITFSIVTPIGIAIGIAVSDGANANRPSLPSGILQGIACGTLLNVVFFEILPKEHSGWRALIASFIGFALMFGLQVLVVEAAGKGTFSCS